MFAWGAGNLMLGIFHGKRSMADGLAYFARGTEVLLGAFGVRRLEYAIKSTS